MHPPLDRFTLAVPFVLALTLLACGPPAAPPPTPNVGAPVALLDDPSHEFDFWLGTWNVQNKQLGFGGRWKDSGTAVARIHSVAGGSAVLERWSGEAGGELEGFSLRAWDPALSRWVIWLNWHGGQPAGFFIMHGERRGERIELFPPGDRSSTRYTFSEAHEGSCRWDSATSRDGETWATDWVMQFSRTGPTQRLDASTVGIELPPETTGDYPETRKLDALLGIWEGAARSTESGDSEGSVNVAFTSMLEGFGTLAFLDTSWGESELAALAHEPDSGGWRGVRAGRGAPGLEPVGVEADPERFVFTGAQSRDVWVRLSPQIYRWQRSTRASDGTWQPSLEAELARRDNQ